MIDQYLDDLRIEIAVLQHDIYAFSNTRARFKIPVIMTEDIVANLSISGNNIVNKTHGNMGSSSISINNTIELFVPIEYTSTMGVDIIPKGTKFIVAFVGANVNDAKIIGRYEESPDDTYYHIIRRLRSNIHTYDWRQEYYEKYGRRVLEFNSVAEMQYIDNAIKEEEEDEENNNSSHRSLRSIPIEDNNDNMVDDVIINEIERIVDEKINSLRIELKEYIDNTIKNK